MSRKLAHFEKKCPLVEVIVHEMSPSHLFYEKSKSPHFMIPLCIVQHRYTHTRVWWNDTTQFKRTARNAFGLYFSLLQFRQKLVSLLQCRRPIKVCQLMRYLVLLAENKGEIKLHYCSFGVGHFISYINNKKILNQRTITEIMLVCKLNLYPEMSLALLYQLVQPARIHAEQLNKITQANLA